LLELVVVIGIILVLMSLVLAVSTIVIQQAESRQLQAVFANLQAAVNEYEQALGRKMTYEDRSDQGGGVKAWDIPFSPELTTPLVEIPYNYLIIAGGDTCSCSSANDQHGWERYIVRLMQLLERTDSAEEIIARIDPNLLVQVRSNNGQPLPDGKAMSSVIDPWGSPLAVVLPGRTWRDGDGDQGIIRDNDGTIRTSLEDKIGICKSATPLFVSAGPDADIGCLKCVNDASSIRYQASIDNIYSYEPEIR
jgi:type II secretory pathway pseudopilin PulG